MEMMEFPEVNHRLAESQDEFHTIPANIDPTDPNFPFTFCVKLNDEELSEVIMSGGLIWLTQWTGGNSFQPIGIETNKPHLVKHDLTPYKQRPPEDDPEKI